MDRVFQNVDSIILLHRAFVESSFDVVKSPNPDFHDFFGLLEMSSALRNRYFAPDNQRKTQNVFVGNFMFSEP